MLLFTWVKSIKGTEILLGSRKQPGGWRVKLMMTEQTLSCVLYSKFASKLALEQLSIMIILVLSCTHPPPHPHVHIHLIIPGFGIRAPEADLVCILPHLPAALIAKPSVAPGGGPIGTCL